MARRILALDLGSRLLKAAVIESSLSRCRVTGLFQQQRVADRVLVEQVQEFCASNQLYGDTVLSCLPGEAVTHRMLTLPFAQARQINQAVPFELEGLIPFSLEEVVIADQIIEQTDNGTLTLAVMALKKTVTEHLEMLAAATLVPAQIMLAPLASLALLRDAQADLAGAVALLDVGEHSTSVVLLQAGTLIDLRTFAIGLSCKGGLEAFLRELQWTFLALGKGERWSPEKIFLAGGGAYFPQLGEELQRQFAAEVVCVQQLTIPGVEPLQQKDQASFATCLGMGLHEALRGTSPMVNLRQGEFAPQRHDETTRVEFRRLGWLAVGVAMAAGLTFMLDVHRLQTRYQALRQEVRRTFVAAAPDTPTIVNEKVQLEDAIDVLRKRQRTVLGSATGSPLDVLRHVSAVIPDQVTLDLDEWTYDEEAIRLQGVTTSFEAAESLKTVIMSLGLFREAQLKDVKTVTGSKKVAFRLQLFLPKPEALEIPRPERDLRQKVELQHAPLGKGRREG